MPGPVTPLIAPTPGIPAAVPTSPGTEPVSTRGATGSLEERLSRVENALDFIPEYTTYPLLVGDMTIAGTGTTYVGGITIPWGTLYRILRIPADRWDIWCAGWYSSPASAMNMTLYYEDDAGGFHTIATATNLLSAVNKKAQGGPYQVRGSFAAANGIPQNESIWSFGLYASMSQQGSGNAGTMSRWTMYIRQSPRRS